MPRSRQMPDSDNLTSDHEQTFPVSDHSDAASSSAEQDSIADQAASASASDMNPESDSDSDLDSEPDLSAPRQRTTNLTQIREIPFGILAQAASSLPSTKRKPSKPSTSISAADPSPALQSLRDRLAEIKAAKVAKGAKSASSSASSSTAPRTLRPLSSSDTIRQHHTRQHHNAHPAADTDSDSDDESTPQEATSKHAPATQSSLKPVSRKRAILPDLSSNPTHARDPRFHASVAGFVNPDAVAKNYAFLTTYRHSELEAMRADLKKTRDAAQRQELLRKVNSMGNRLKAAEVREREKELTRAVRRKERESVRQGKKPFFMKKGEIRKKVREEMLGDLSEKARAKRDERREKKKSGRELRRKPDQRRRPLA